MNTEQRLEYLVQINGSLKETELLCYNTFSKASEESIKSICQYYDIDFPEDKLETAGDYMALYMKMVVAHRTQLSAEIFSALKIQSYVS